MPRIKHLNNSSRKRTRKQRRGPYQNTDIMYSPKVREININIERAH